MDKSNKTKSSKSQPSILNWAIPESKRAKHSEPDLREEDCTPADDSTSSEGGDDKRTLEDNTAIGEDETNHSSELHQQQESLSKKPDISAKPFQSGIPAAQILSQRILNFQKKWFNDFPWLHYNPSNEAVFCHTCLIAEEKKLFSSGTKLEPAFVITGFKNWKKGPEKFLHHQNSNQHKEAVVKLQQSVDIAKSISDSAQETFRLNKEALRIIISSIQFLGKQGLAFQGHLSADGNFMELLRLRANDLPFLRTWLSKPKTYTSHDIQNEICEIMSHMILRKLCSILQESNYYSLIVDETTDVSTKEQVSICLRRVNKSTLEAEELFMGLYSTASTTGETLTKIILDALLRFNLPTNKLRGQCYDGGANMKGNIVGVQRRILEVEPRAVYIHCFNHSLNLALQDSIKSIPALRDSLTYLHEIATLFSRSAKRLSILESAQQQSNKPSTTLKPLCPTRWCVRVVTINSILNNYAEVMEALESLRTSKDPCAPTASGLLLQMEGSDFCVNAIILRNLFMDCENLAKVLQSPTASVNGTIKAAELVLARLTEMKSEATFDDVWNELQSFSTKFQLNPIRIPRKRQKPARYRNDSTISNSADENLTPKSFIFKMYLEAIENLLNELHRRFSQESLKEWSEIENLILSNDCDFSSENLKSTCSKYEINHTALKFELEIFRKLNGDSSSVENCASFVSTLHPDVKGLLPEMQKLIELLLVLPASTATAERSFSMLRRLKTYLRSTMGQERLNHLSVMNVHKDELEKLDIDEVVKEFVSQNAFRVNQFGVC